MPKSKPIIRIISSSDSILVTLLTSIFYLRLFMIFFFSWFLCYILHLWLLRWLSPSLSLSSHPYVVQFSAVACNPNAQMAFLILAVCNFMLVRYMQHVLLFFFFFSHSFSAAFAAFSLQKSSSPTPNKATFRHITAGAKLFEIFFMQFLFFIFDLDCHTFTDFMMKKKLWYAQMVSNSTKNSRRLSNVAFLTMSRLTFNVEWKAKTIFKTCIFDC